MRSKPLPLQVHPPWEPELAHAAKPDFLKVVDLWQVLVGLNAFRGAMATMVLQGVLRNLIHLELRRHGA